MTDNGEEHGNYYSNPKLGWNVRAAGTAQGFRWLMVRHVGK